MSVWPVRRCLKMVANTSLIWQTRNFDAGIHVLPLFKPVPTFRVRVIGTPGGSAVRPLWSPCMPARGSPMNFRSGVFINFLSDLD